GHRALVVIKAEDATRQHYNRRGQQSGIEGVGCAFVPGTHEPFSEKPVDTCICTACQQWQARRVSNPQPAVLETAALPVELLACVRILCQPSGARSAVPRNPCLTLYQ